MARTLPIRQEDGRLDEDDDDGEGDGDGDGEVPWARSLLSSVDSSLRISSAKARYANSSTTFRSNCSLACSVAIYTSLFALPTYWVWLKYEVFGQALDTVVYRGYTQYDVDNGFAPLCEGWMTGPYWNVAPQNTTPVLAPFNSSFGVWDDAKENATWCGHFPDMYLSYYGNAAQMIIFTVYCNTGTTVQLAWQGVIGTTLAVINAWFVEMVAEATGSIEIVSCQEFFKCEARPEQCKQLSWDTGLKVCQNAGVTKDAMGEVKIKYHPKGTRQFSWQLGLWSDTIGVIFLYLISGAAENTMKFGLSWHVYFMMEWFNPTSIPSRYHYPTWIPHFEWDSEYAAVVLTSLLGAVIAVVATIIPNPLTNVHRLREEAENATNAAIDIINESITYFCGTKQTAKRFQILEKITKFDGIVSGIQAHASATWWETFDIGRFNNKRRLFQMYDDQCKMTNSVLYALGTAIKDESFNGRHNAFSSQVGPQLLALTEQASYLQLMCAQICDDGLVDDEERDELDEQAQQVERCQFELLRSVEPFSNGVTRDLANEEIVVYAVSYWARGITDLAREISDEKNASSRMCRSCFEGVQTGFLNTWNPKLLLCDGGHVNFAVRNLISISICFFIGVVGLPGSMFGRWESKMASTLSLLISHFSGSAVQKSLQRLLGVVMGKCMPIIIFTILSVSPCDSFYRPFVQFFAMCIFTQCFCYMYYTSAQYALVGCLVAGFGVPILMRTCMSAATGFDYASEYKAVGQVIFAVLIQTIVDNLMLKSSARQLAVNHMQSAGEGLLEGFEAFFNRDFPGMRECYDKAIASLQSAEAIAAETDPKLQLAPSASTPFQYEAYLEMIAIMKHLASDLRCLVLACSFHPTRPSSDAEDDVDADFLELIVGCRAAERCKRDLLEQLDDGLQSAISILSHSDEAPITESHLKDLENRSGINQLDGLEEFFREVDGLKMPPRSIEEPTKDVNLRSCVALRSLRNAASHSGSLEEICVRKNV